MDYVEYAKQIAIYFINAENKVKEKIRQKFKQRTIDDVPVLHTMLERCSQSSNSQLKEDLHRHNIPEKLKGVANLVMSKHCHGWNAEESQKGYYTFFDCIQKESNWNSTGMKVGIVGAGILGGVFMFGIPTIITGKIVYDISAHANEVEEKLTWVVNEIEALYDQTNALMIANIV